MSQPAREQWSSRLGFVLAAVGSAVGLGNMWRFPYLVAESGGAAFVLLYILLTATVGLPVLLVELTIGRGARRSPVAALGYLGGNAWRALGALFVLSGFLIAAYYSVIAGWTLRYGVVGLLGGFPDDPGAYFAHVTESWSAVGWHFVLILLAVSTVQLGVRHGIERLALSLMPALFLLICGLAIYAATLDGGAAGYRFYLAVDFAELLEPRTLNHAASQAFFSLSLGMGAILTFASYLPDDSDLPTNSLSIAGADFAVAFVAGLAVFPMVFAFGLADAVDESALGALFITLPRAFVEMGVAGRIVGIFFFLALVIGALTSLISLIEVVVASAMDVLGWSRRRAAVLLGSLIALLGVAPAFSLNLLGLMDQLAGSFMLVAGGLGMAVFAGWVMREPAAEMTRGARGPRWTGLWLWLVRIPVPLALAYVLVQLGRDVLATLRGLLA